MSDQIYTRDDFEVGQTVQIVLWHGSQNVGHPGEVVKIARTLVTVRDHRGIDAKYRIESGREHGADYPSRIWTQKAWDERFLRIELLARLRDDHGIEVKGIYDRDLWPTDRIQRLLAVADETKEP